MQSFFYTLCDVTHTVSELHDKGGERAAMKNIVQLQQMCTMYVHKQSVALKADNTEAMR